MTQWKWKQRISSEIFDMKYKFHRESVEQVFDDVATVVASAETEEKRQEMKEQFYQMMIEEKFIPAGRILANAWPNSPIQNYMNCYTIGVDDSMEDIYNSLKEDAMISKVGGGVGFDVSNLRPKNSDLSVGGVASGPISFLKVFDASAKVIMTGGARRAAHIALMDVAHPDIEEFITVKQGDKNKALTQFNISVKVTDKFIEAVKNDDDWNLEFEGKVYKTVKAKYLYDLMSKNAFINNEPGIFNVDTINRYNNGFWAFDINEVNPCFTGDTLVAVADGRNAVRFDELAKEGRDVPVYAKDDNGKTVIKMMRNISLTRKDAQLVEITLDDDSKIKCTPDHRIMLRDGSYKEAKDLVANESLKPFNSYISNKNYRQIQSGTKRDRRQYRMIAEYNNLIVDPKTTAIHHNDYDSFNDSINNLVIMSHEEHRKLHAERMMGKNNPYHKKSKEWQSKMASHPGEKNGRYSGYTDEQLISLMIEWIKERNYPMSGDDWRRLAKENGYPQYFTSFRKSLIEMLEKANASCGFNFSKDKYKQREYRKKMMATAMINHKVKSVKYIHSEDVYDGTVDDVHNFAVITSNKDDKFIESSGVFVHNCGEIVMPRYSICCLSSTNLASFVKNKFEDNAYFDFDEFGRVVRLGVRFLDNILSVAKYPLKKIEENALGWRRIGLGFTALGNAFQYMKMSYGSEESKELSEKIAQVLRDESYRASADLAKEKGKFPFYDDQINEASFIKQLPDDIRDEIREHGLRNIALNTTAPNGTISLSVGQNCVKGDTEVSTLEGKIKIKDLVGKNPYVYCVDDDGNPAVRKAKKVWLSRKDAPVVKVVFDDDSSLVCTEDHEIRLSSGEYVKAKDLKFMDSVTAFYKQLVGNGGRDIVTSYIGVTGNSNRSREHRVVAEMMLGRKLNDDEHVHHIDEDRLNNLPENLEILNPQEHAKKHNNFNKLNKLRKGMSYEEIYGKEQAAEIKEKKSKIVPWNKGRKHSEETKKKISKALSNHKVKEIIFNYDVCDVYDMEVEEIHNFVANGIVIHNCSSGIEPTFALSYTRNYRTGTDDEMASEAVYDKAWLEFIEHSTGKEVSGDEVKFDKPDWFTVAADVDPYDSIDIQAIFQKYIDHSISKTLNLPPGTTQEQYNDLFMYAYDNGLKGFTTFNPEGCGSPDTRVLTTDGIKTFGEIFEAEDIDIYDEQNKGWVDLKNDLEFYDENGNTCKINKAFIKGLTSNMLNITLESGETLCVSPEHKFMINGEWIEAKNLKEGDDLDVYQGELGKSQKTS